METRCIIPKQKRNDSYQVLEKLMNQHKQMVEVIPDLMRHTHTGKFPDSNLEKQVHQFFFFRITQYNEDAHNTHAHSHPMNTRTQTLPLWAPPKDWAPADLKIPEVTTGASSSTGTSLTT